MKPRGKEQVCLYIDKKLMERARVVSGVSGVPLSKLAEVGMRKQVERQEALMLLAESEVGN